MGYQSPYMRFGDTRYEKDIVKLRQCASHRRSKAYEDAKEALAEACTMPDASLNYINNVAQHASDCSHNLGQTKDDDSVLVQQYAKHALGDDEYYWMKSELAKKGEEWEEPPWQIPIRGDAR